MVISEHLSMEALLWQAKMAASSHKPDTWTGNLPWQECPAAEGRTSNLLETTDWEVPPETAVFQGSLKKTTCYIHLWVA